MARKRTSKKADPLKEDPSNEPKVGYMPEDANDKERKYKFSFYLKTISAKDHEKLCVARACAVKLKNKNTVKTLEEWDEGLEILLGRMAAKEFESEEEKTLEKVIEEVLPDEIIEEIHEENSGGDE